MFKSLLKAASSVVDVPVAMAADALTLGDRHLSENPGKCHTADALERARQNVEDLASPEK